MPRIRQLADKYAADDRQKAKEAFWMAIDIRAVETVGKNSNAAIGAVSGVEQRTVTNNRNGSAEMKISTMQKLIAALKPDIKAVLRFLGYSDKEIKRFAQSIVN